MRFLWGLKPGKRNKIRTETNAVMGAYSYTSVSPSIGKRHVSVIKNIIIKEIMFIHIFNEKAL